MQRVFLICGLLQLLLLLARVQLLDDQVQLLILVLPQDLLAAVELAQLWLDGAVWRPALLLHLAVVEVLMFVARVELVDLEPAQNGFVRL